MGAGPRKGPVTITGQGVVDEESSELGGAPRKGAPAYAATVGLNTTADTERLDRDKEVHDDIKGVIECTEALEKMYAEGTPAHRQCRDIIAKLTRALSNL